MADGDFSSSTDTTEGQSHSYSIDSPVPKDSGAKDKIMGAGKSLSDKGQKMIADGSDKLASQNRGVASFRKGGRVRKTGLIHAHKNEEVVRPEQADKVRRFLKKDKGRSSDEEMDDPKRTARKGDPARIGKKEEPARTAKKHDPKKTFSRNAPKRMSAKRKGKRSKGREM